MMPYVTSLLNALQKTGGQIHGHISKHKFETISDKNSHYFNFIKVIFLCTEVFLVGKNVGKSNGKCLPEGISRE